MVISPVELTPPKPPVAGFGLINMAVVIISKLKPLTKGIMLKIKTQMTPEALSLSVVVNVRDGALTEVKTAAKAQTAELIRVMTNIG